MTKNVKFVLNRRAFRDQILRGQGVDMESALRDALPGDDVDVQVGAVRMRARVYGDLADEAATGMLSQRLGGSA